MSERVVWLPDGVRVAIQGPLQQQKHWLKGRYYEQPMLDHIRAHYRGGTFVDGGACIGNHTLWFARYCADQVIAVEPVERNLAHLRRNVELSGLQGKVLAVAAALGERAGRGSMRPAGPYHGHYQLNEGDEVEVTTLDALAALAGHPVTLVKLDVEGCEIPALRGGLALLGRDGPALFVELPTPEALRAAEALLSPLGYTRRARFGGTPLYEYRVG